MPQSMYRQIADAIQQRIEDGELPRGTQLPTELELREAYGASRNTIRDALKRLVNLGLVESRPGRGKFVSPGIDPFVTTLSMHPERDFSGGEGVSYLSDVHAARRSPRVSLPQVEVRLAEPAIRRHLRVPAGTEVVIRRQQCYIDETPWSLQSNFYPIELVERGAEFLLVADDIKQGTVVYLAESIGARQTGYRDWIAARRPDEDEQEFFAISGDTPVLEVLRTAFDQDNNPIRFAVSVFPSDRNQFIYNIGQDLPKPRYHDIADD